MAGFWYDAEPILLAGVLDCSGRAIRRLKESLMRDRSDWVGFGEGGGGGKVGASQALSCSSTAQVGELKPLFLGALQGEKAADPASKV